MFYTLHFTPYTSYLTPYTLFIIHCTLYLIPVSLYLMPYALCPHHINITAKSYFLLAMLFLEFVPPSRLWLNPISLGRKEYFVKLCSCKLSTWPSLPCILRNSCRRHIEGLRFKGIPNCAVDGPAYLADSAFWNLSSQLRLL